nr:MAG TPA: hypothetical protein [Caudoviricetes sp.]
MSGRNFYAYYAHFLLTFMRIMCIIIIERRTG